MRDSNGDFTPHPPSTGSTSGRPSARALLSQISIKEPPTVPSVWTEIQSERRKVIEAPSARAVAQDRTDLSIRVNSALAPPAAASDSAAKDESFDTLLEIRTRIDELLDEQQSRATENEANLGELRLILENLNFQIDDDSNDTDIQDSAKYVREVQNDQLKLQDSIRFLVKGAAQLFLQNNRLKVDRLRSEIADMTQMTAQVDEQIRIKKAVLEEKLNACAKIDATNANLRRRIESTKNEIRAIAGQDFEEIPELARTYQDTMKRIIGEEVELTKQLWAVQQQLEREKKEQVQLAVMCQKVRDHPVRMAQLQKELDGKLAVMRTELFEKEKLRSQQRGELATNYQNETQRLVIQAKKEREEQLFRFKTAQIEQLLQAEKQSREEKMSVISQANASLASNRQFKQKVAQFDRESKTLVDSYDQTVRRLKVEFSQAERKMKREHDLKIQAAEEEARIEKKTLENEVAQMEMTLAAKDAQYQQSCARLENLQNQLTQLKEKIARYDISNRHLEKAISSNSVETDDLMMMLRENQKSKMEEKNAVKRRMLDVITSVAYFMVLTGEKDGDWMEEAEKCYQAALQECESDLPQVGIVPVPFARQKTAESIANAPLLKTARRRSFTTTVD
jgi:myosin heavy subunit